MLGVSATGFATDMWFVEHLFPRLASVPPLLHESLLLFAVQANYLPHLIALESLFLQSLHSGFKMVSHRFHDLVLNPNVSDLNFPC